jgi:opacity protein-like surface antigen
MRTLLLAIVCAGGLSFATDVCAEDRSAFLQGFGGLRLGTVATTDTVLGGLVAKSVTPNLQVLGEVGRLSDVLPTTIDPLLAFSPVGFRVSAWYGQAGIRLAANTRSGARPYVETSAGVARLQSNLGPLGSSLADVIANSSLRLFDRTDPIATVGGGLAFESGPFIADIGYRYRRIFGPAWIEALSFDNRLTSNEVRVGIGVRF